jgi:CRP/FNR family cyclic AMP-dependent transcriptional regulator
MKLKDNKEKEIKTVMICIADEDEREIIQQVLSEELMLRVVPAQTNHEARLKSMNEKIDLYILEMHNENFNTKEFVEGVHKKGEIKSMKEMPETLVIAMDVENYNKTFKGMNHMSCMTRPYTGADLKKKVQSFNGKKDAITENTKKISEGEFLIKEDEASKEMFWVISGNFEITKKNKEGNRVVVGTVFPGELVGEMSFLDAMPRSASVQAKQDSEVLVIPHKKFNDVIESQPKWFRSLMKTLSNRLRHANELISKKVALVREDDDSV